MRKGWHQPGVGIDVWRNVRWIDQGYELVVSRTGLSWIGRVFRDGSCWMGTSSMCATDSMIACEDFAYWKCGGFSDNQPHKPTQAEIEELCKGITVEESPFGDSALRAAYEELRSYVYALSVSPWALENAKPTLNKADALLNGVDTKTRREVVLTQELQRVREWLSGWMVANGLPPQGVINKSSEMTAYAGAIQEQYAKINAILGEDK